jgi:uncharacterized membrane protein
MNSVVAPMSHQIFYIFLDILPLLEILFVSFGFIIFSIVLIIIGNKKHYEKNYVCYHGIITSKNKLQVVIYIEEIHNTVTCKSFLPLNTKVLVYINKKNQNNIKLIGEDYYNFNRNRYIIGGIILLLLSVLAFCVSGVLIFSYIVSNLII